MPRIQASAEVSFEANSVEEIRALVEIFTRQLAPVLWEDDAPTLAPRATVHETVHEPSEAVVSPPVKRGGESEPHEIKRLAKLYREKAGKRFFHGPGEGKLEALRAATAAFA